MSNLDGINGLFFISVYSFQLSSLPDTMLQTQYAGVGSQICAAMAFRVHRVSS